MKKVRWDNIALFISIFVILWIVASVVDVNIHNDICNNGYGDFAWWNLFEILIKGKVIE